MCWWVCAIENLPFQVHTLSHPEEALSWFCRSRGCLGDCTKAVYMDQMCETETQKAGNHTPMSFRWCTVQKTAKGNAWAWQAYFKPCLISEIWCKYSFPTKMHGELTNDQNRKGQYSYCDIITPKRKKASKFKHVFVNSVSRRVQTSETLHHPQPVMNFPRDSSVFSQFHSRSDFNASCF